MSGNSKFLIELRSSENFKSYWYFNTLDRCLYVLPKKVPSKYVLGSDLSSFLGFNICNIFCNQLELYCNFGVCLMELGKLNLVGFRCSKDTLLASVKKECECFNSYFYVTSDEWQDSSLWQKIEFMTDCLSEGIPVGNMPDYFLSRETLRDNWGRVLGFLFDEVSPVLSVKYGTTKKKVMSIINSCSDSFALSTVIDKLKEYKLSKVASNLRKESRGIEGVLSVTLINIIRDGKDVEDVLLELCLSSDMSAVEYLRKVKSDEAFRKRFVDAVILNALCYINKGKSANSDNIVDRKYLAVKRLLPRGSYILATVGLRSDILEVKRKLEESSQ